MPTPQNAAERDELDDRREQFLAGFGAAVLARRTHLDLTQRQVDARMGYRGRFVGGVERGRRNITLTTLYALAAALETDPRALLAGPDVAWRAELTSSALQFVASPP
ncbi:helix-turn-helix domain-containing protein [Jiangella asiatica]|uniref:XRE family transcriptional regulator n=1 Tax=Jiangella asiatica TaxID=2530372 RepID=A0A4V2Z3T5_9ACTN|nr:helix-turn-helix transcriptional regulator [Jiangella asiatica]TDE13568.1 XRE family transcriptional regulator [Jiangella asiatica]